MKTTTQILPYDHGYKAGFEGRKYKNPYRMIDNEGYDFDFYKNGFNFGADDRKDFLIGQNIATMLNLEVAEVIGGQNRYNTFWGTKTEIGLARSLRAIINGEKVLND
jgi:hypothetical protein